MQEVALILSSLAGVATAAAAVRRMPRNKSQLLSIGASSHIKSQISSLKIEKDILTKTISRLYQADSEFSKIQKDKLLLKYQHQLGIILAKLEKLDQASKHPDLGPVGDGLITLMDQKLSKLDDRLYELSSKMTNAEIEAPRTGEEKVKKQEARQSMAKSLKDSLSLEKQKEAKIEPIEIPPVKSRQSFELTTLTNISKKEPTFPLFSKEEPRKFSNNNVKPMPQPKIIHPESVTQKEEVVKETVQPKSKVEDKIEIIQSVSPKHESQLATKPDIDREVARIAKHKALPEPEAEPREKPRAAWDDDDFDEDADDLDRIKGDIMKVLSKIDQAEVE